MSKIFHVAFEVYGTVQGVSFRMYTQKQAKTLGIRGWCMNTNHDTVKGEIEGEPKAFEQMKNWLEKTGSPNSRIEKVIYNDIKELDKYTYDDFTIRH